MTIADLPQEGNPGKAVEAAQAAQKAAETVSNALNVQSVEWIDWTAIVLLAVFFLLGLFKGFWWQVSRVVTLVAAWVLAGKFGPAGESVFAGWFDPTQSPAELPLFLSYVSIFLLTVVILSIVAMLFSKLIQSSGLSFYDRLGGAVLGLGTGAVGVIAILAGIYMFVPQDYGVVQAAQRSRTMGYSQKTLRFIRDYVPQPMQKVFEIEEGAAAGEPGEPGRAPMKKLGTDPRAGKPGEQPGPGQKK